MRPPTWRKTLMILQSMLRVAVEWQRIPSNPVNATLSRPCAPLALRWRNVRERTLLVEAAVAHGKPSYRTRRDRHRAVILSATRSVSQRMGSGSSPDRATGDSAMRFVHV